MSISLSVIVPVFNSGDTAILSIKSILNQTFNCTEIIVVDDGSTDNSVELIGNAFGDDCRIKLYSIKNTGAAGARNFGILKSSSDYVAFLDSDDVWSSQKIELQIKELEDDFEIGLIGSLTNIPGFYRRGFSANVRLSIVSLRMLLFKNYFQTSTVVIRRTILNEMGGFPIGRRFAEEGDLFMRVAAKFKCVLINEILVDYAGGKRGFGTAGLSANLWRMELGELSNILRVFARGDIGLFLTGASIAFSLVKYFRRVVIYVNWKIFRSN